MGKVYRLAQKQYEVIEKLTLKQFCVGDSSEWNIPQTRRYLSLFQSDSEQYSESQGILLKLPRFHAAVLYSTYSINFLPNCTEVIQNTKI